jgi:protein-S-isoprenylcysteine O-methyltransferase Ste14
MGKKPHQKRIFGREDHIGREDLASEHASGDIGQIVLACAFAAVWIVDTFIFKYTTFLNRYIPLIVRILPAAVVVILSAYLAKTGLSIVFHEVREKPEVIRKSVFGVVRHPIYLSEILLYLGLLILSLSLAATIVWIIAFVFLHYISRYKERQLLAQFGKDYELYMREVPMWFPRLGGK